MNHHRDFEELLSALSSERVEFLIVGAYAVMAVTEPRYTKDLDVWVRPSRANARRVYRALERFGAPLDNLRVRDLEREGIIFQIGVEPVRIDILTQVDGIDFEGAFQRAVRGKYGNVELAFLSVADLIENKKRVGRPQDLLDVAKLEAIAPKKSKVTRAKLTRAPKRKVKAKGTVRTARPSKRQTRAR
jgi:hypothetical protein